MLQELVVTAVTPEDTLDEEVLSERRVGGDRWPRANKDVKSLVAAERFVVLCPTVGAFPVVGHFTYLLSGFSDHSGHDNVRPR